MGLCNLKFDLFKLDLKNEITAENPFFAFLFMCFVAGNPTVSESSIRQCVIGRFLS